MKLESLMEKHHPDIHARMTSPQFPLAEKLLAYKIVYALTEREMAALTGVSMEEFIRMENVDLGIPLETYLAAINLFKKCMMEKNQSEEC